MSLQLGNLEWVAVTWLHDMMIMVAILIKKIGAALPVQEIPVWRQDCIMTVLPPQGDFLYRSDDIFILTLFQKNLYALRDKDWL